MTEVAEKDAVLDKLFFLYVGFLSILIGHRYFLVWNHWQAFLRDGLFSF